MARGTSNARRRPYDNRLRQQQAEATKEHILERMMELIGREGLAAFSVGKLAKAAGVSEPTIYRHFGSREGLAEVWSKWFEKRGGHPGFPETIEGAIAAMPTLFRWFGEHADYVRAAQVAADSELVRPGRVQRRQRLAELFAPLVEHLDPDEKAGILGVLGYLVSARAWLVLCDEQGLSIEQAGRAVQRAIRAIVDDLQRTSTEGGER